MGCVCNLQTRSLAPPFISVTSIVIITRPFATLTAELTVEYASKSISGVISRVSSQVGFCLLLC